MKPACLVHRGLTGQTARRIGGLLRGAVTVTLPYGSVLIGRDRDVHRVAIIGFATHPNIGAALLMGDNPTLMADVIAELRAPVAVSRRSRRMIAATTR